MLLISWAVFLSVAEALPCKDCSSRDALSALSFMGGSDQEKEHQMDSSQQTKRTRLPPCRRPGGCVLVWPGKWQRKRDQMDSSQQTKRTKRPCSRPGQCLFVWPGKRDQMDFQEPPCSQKGKCMKMGDSKQEKEEREIDLPKPEKTDCSIGSCTFGGDTSNEATGSKRRLNFRIFQGRYDASKKW